jgi:hypothetical protein
MFIYHVPFRLSESTLSAEQHLGYAQVINIMGGSGTIVAGGELESAAILVEKDRQIFGELRGRAVKGGKSFQVKTGDAMSIPPNTPVEVTADAPGGLTYMAMKINAMLYPWDLIR